MCRYQYYFIKKQNQHIKAFHLRKNLIILVDVFCVLFVKNAQGNMDISDRSQLVLNSYRLKFSEYSNVGAKLRGAYLYIFQQSPQIRSQSRGLGGWKDVTDMLQVTEADKNQADLPAKQRRILLRDTRTQWPFGVGTNGAIHVNWPQKILC